MRSAPPPTGRVNKAVWRGNQGGSREIARDQGRGEARLACTCQPGVCLLPLRSDRESPLRDSLIQNMAGRCTRTNTNHAHASSVYLVSALSQLLSKLRIRACRSRASGLHLRCAIRRISCKHLGKHADANRQVQASRPRERSDHRAGITLVSSGRARTRHNTRCARSVSERSMVYA